jgi:hypothetical protein
MPKIAATKMAVASYSMALNFFGVLFNKVLSYAKIVSGTADIGELPDINELFKLGNLNKSWCTRWIIGGTAYAPVCT